MYEHKKRQNNAGSVKAAQDEDRMENTYIKYEERGSGKGHKREGRTNEGMEGKQEYERKTNEIDVLCRIIKQIVN